MEIWKSIDVFITNLLNNIGAFAPILACLLILVESIFPILPLALFITINFYYMGALIGFLVSWVLTCIGCYISFRLCRNLLKKYFDRMLDKKDHHKLKKMMKAIDDLTLEQLAVVIAIPFTPAFMVNIAAGLSNMNHKKYITAIIIGKIFLVYFWGFVGTSLLESFENPKIILEILLIIVLAFIISKVINKRFHLE
jgi:uncharacterized membrane protein YdjX (TVP38/TMEM64 family)